MKLAIFYHVAQLNDWRWKLLYQNQIHSIVFSGLYDSLNYFYVGINGDEPLPETLPKIIYGYNKNKISEADTLKTLHNFCQNNDGYKILYIHTKGVSWQNDPKEYNVHRWRQYLEYFTIWKWRQNINLLDKYDCVGTEYWPVAYLNGEKMNFGHFSGNFWWATSSYIKSLDVDFLYNPIDEDIAGQRWKSEFWIGTGNPKLYNYTNVVKEISDLYYHRFYVPTEYINVEKNMNDIKINLKNGKLEINQPIDNKQSINIVEPQIKTKINNKEKKFVMITMFKNEAHTIERMLQSCYRYIDYYVIQDNGSTDGTPEIVEKFFQGKNIPGFVYKCEEGWKGFGWNRDHLLQRCQQAEHGCDWILKMDCDEILEVDDNFDWSIFNNTNIQAFHVPNVRGGTIYNRAWIWNAKLPWRFNHDTSHETISLEIDGIGENFERVNLPKEFRHVSFNDGQSWTVPTKFLSDALILEEKMIKEGTLLKDQYHFWYIGKSYNDAYKICQLPLDNHNDEYARRCIWWFQKFLDVTHNFSKNLKAERLDEMGYYAALLIGQAYGYLNDNENKILWLEYTDSFCPKRNEHLVILAETYLQTEQYDKMLEITTKLVYEDRLNPFPEFMFIIDNNCYRDTGTYVFDLHKIAQEKTQLKSKKFNLNLNRHKTPSLFVVDNFYQDPNSIREYALTLEFVEDLRYFKGLRSREAYRPKILKECFEKIIGQKIHNWDDHGFNGVFQITNAQDPQVYHYDSQKWAGIIYLTPNAPLKSGTRLHKSILTGARNRDEENIDASFDYGFYDSTKFDTVDDVGNIYNRLIIMDAKNIHSAGPYFGQNKENGRLIHLFFFD